MSTRDEIRYMRNADPSITAAMLADHLGVTRERVRQILSELGLPTKVPGSSAHRRAKGDKPKKPRPQSKSQKLLRLVIEKYDSRCQYCGTTCVRGSPNFGMWPHVDHLSPQANGGDHSPDNLVLACGACNSTKATQSLEAARHGIALKYLGWPRLPRDAMPWLRSRGFDLSEYDSFKFFFERT